MGYLAIDVHFTAIKNVVKNFFIKLEIMHSGIKNMHMILHLVFLNKI